MELHGIRLPRGTGGGGGGGAGTGCGCAEIAQFAAIIIFTAHCVDVASNSNNSSSRGYRWVDREGEGQGQKKRGATQGSHTTFAPVAVPRKSLTAFIENNNKNNYAYATVACPPPPFSRLPLPAATPLELMLSSANLDEHARQ